MVTADLNLDAVCIVIDAPTPTDACDVASGRTVSGKVFRAIGVSLVRHNLHGGHQLHGKTNVKKCSTLRRHETRMFRRRC
jgi:hypothetical protein